MAANDFGQFANRPMTVVAVGKTGKGKSTTLNSLIKCANDLQTNGTKVDDFLSEDGPDSKTKEVAYRDIKLPDLPTCRLVDTVGLFDTKLTKKRKQELDVAKMSHVDEEHALVLKQFLQVVDLCKDGIDAFFFVVKATDRATQEEMETVDIIFRYLGWNMLDYVIFVVTGKDTTTIGNFEGWKTRICNALQGRGYPSEHVKNRFIFIDNMNPTAGQAEELLELVLYVSKVNRGNPYTPVAFQEAQRVLEEEKKKLRADLEAQFQTKVDEKMKPIQQRHEKEINKLQGDINKAVEAAAKLREDQIEERQQFEKQIDSLKVEQQEEKRRMDQQIQRMMEDMAVQQRDAYDRQYNQMASIIDSMNEERKQRQKESELLINRLDEERKQRAMEREAAERKEEAAEKRRQMERDEDRKERQTEREAADRRLEEAEKRRQTDREAADRKNQSEIDSLRRRLEIAENRDDSSCTIS